MSVQPKKKFALGDRIVERLRDGEPLDHRERDSLAALIETYWSGTPKSNSSANRAVLTAYAMRERGVLVRRGMPIGEANKELYRKYGHNSPGAFDRSLRRNRPLIYWAVFWTCLAWWTKHGGKCP
jgi:hypothetical protein